MFLFCGYAYCLTSYANKDTSHEKDIMRVLKFKKTTIAAIAAILFSATASAELSIMDWQVEGDAKIAQDSETGIDWLRLTNTQGMSIDDVVAELGEGGEFEGWRLPTADEVQTMMGNVYTDYTFDDEGTSEFTGYRWYTGGSDYQADLRTAWGETLGYRYYTTSNGSNRYWLGYGLYLNDEDNAESLAGSDVLMSGFGYRKSDGGQANSYKYYTYIYNDYESENYATDYKSANYGVYLVSDTAMSYTAVPTSGAFVASMLLMGAFARKKKTTKKVV